MQLLQDVVVAIRNLRAEYNVPPSKELAVTVYGNPPQTLSDQWKLVRSLARVGEFSAKDGEPEHGELAAVVGDLQIGVRLAGTIDVAAEQARLDKDLTKTNKERQGVQGRLGNPSFVDRAPPDIVEKERARLTELEEKIAKLTRSLERLRQL
jgi:valyl-tRNA synthetase